MYALLHIFSCFGETFLLGECEFSENVAISTFFFFFLNRFVCCFQLCFMYLLHFMQDFSLLYHNIYCFQHLNIKVCILYITFYIIIWIYIYINRFNNVWHIILRYLPAEFFSRHKMMYSQ